MKKLDEKLSLLRMAQAFGVDPDPKLLEEIDYLQKKESKRQQQQAELSQRTHAATQAMFEAPTTEYKRLNHYPDGKPIPAALPDRYQIQTNKSVPAGQNCHNCEYMQENGGCSRWKGAKVRANYWCAKWEKIEKKDLKEEVLIQPPKTAADQVADFITRNPVKEATVVGPEPALVPKLSDPITKKVDQLEKWISRIAATGPGGGAGDVVNLDYPVKTITTSSYTILRKDHYIGVNVDTSTTIVLPTTGTKQGRNLIIKDESGQCSVNRITLTGTVDADTSGAILAIDYGALHLIYNNGWRVV